MLKSCIGIAPDAINKQRIAAKAERYKTLSSEELVTEYNNIDDKDYSSYSFKRNIQKQLKEKNLKVFGGRLVERNTVDAHYPIVDIRKNHKIPARMTFVDPPQKGEYTRDDIAMNYYYCGASIMPGNKIRHPFGSNSNPSFHKHEFDTGFWGTDLSWEESYKDHKAHLLTTIDFFNGPGPDPSRPNCFSMAIDGVIPIDTLEKIKKSLIKKGLVNEGEYMKPEKLTKIMEETVNVLNEK